MQQNAFTSLSYLKPITSQAALVTIGEYLQDKAGRTIDERMARVANIIGVFPYLRQSARKQFFEAVLSNMTEIGTNWSSYQRHGELLRTFQDYGGLEHAPHDVRVKMLKYLVITYVGSPGGKTQFGNVRHVYYSNTAAPIIEKLIDSGASLIKDDLKKLRSDKDVKRALCTEHISRRFENLVDIVDQA